MPGLLARHSSAYIIHPMFNFTISVFIEPILNNCNKKINSF